MSSPNIYNPTTGETGYQIPGAPIAAGWQAGTPGAAPTPVTAPSGQTATSQAPATPTAVVSSSTAANDVSNISKTVNDAQASIDAQSASKAAAATALAQANASKPPVPPAPAKTPEQQLMDTPDQGMQFVYDKNTGARSEVPIGTPPQGTTMTDVQNASAQDTASVGSTTYKQFSDGTYGAFDAAGKYIGPANQQNFIDAKGVNKAQSDLIAIQNGSYPLTAGQQSQIDQVSDYYQSLIEAQKVENANVTGNTTGLQNLYGVGGTSVGLSAINKTIADGAAKIAELQRKMVEGVSALKSAIQTDNINLVKSLYNGYKQNVDDMQKHIDDMHNEAMQAKAAQQAEVDKVDTSIKSIIDEAAKNGASPEVLSALQKSLDAHDYAGAMQSAAGHLQDPTSDAGQYSSYVQQQKTAGKAPMSAGDFISAQKAKQAYASAAASAAAQDAFVSGDAHQGKLEKQLQAAALNSRSNLGVQSKKVSAAIAAQVLLNQYTKPDGTYDVPAAAYGELLLSVANMLSPTGVASVTTQDGLRTATASGDINAAITYAFGHPMPGTTQDVINNLATTVKNEGNNAEIARNQELEAQTPTDLDPVRASHVVGSLPSYNKMSNGDLGYQTPQQINETAINKVVDFRLDTTPNPVTGKTNEEVYQNLVKQFPNASPVERAQALGVMPTK